MIITQCNSEKTFFENVGVLYVFRPPEFENDTQNIVSPTVFAQIAYFAIMMIYTKTPYETQKRRIAFNYSTLAPLAAHSKWRCLSITVLCLCKEVRVSVSVQCLPEAV